MYNQKVKPLFTELFKRCENEGSVETVKFVSKITGIKIPVTSECYELDYENTIAYCWLYVQKAEGISNPDIETDWGEKEALIIDRAYEFNS